MEYTAFAEVYDEFMSNIPYNEWADLIAGRLVKEQKGERILELGCGTGTFTFLMEEKGYQITGIDCSKDMVDVARAKARKNRNKSRFLLQDMRMLELNEKFDCVISICDSMNYMQDLCDLDAVFSSVAKVLDDEGLFLFDMKTEAFFEELGENVFTDETEKGDYIWKNFYDKENRDNFYELSIYVHKKNNLYTKYMEEHLQHVFTRSEVVELARENGFEVIDVVGMDLVSPADYEAERVYYIFKKKEELK